MRVRARWPGRHYAVKFRGTRQEPRLGWPDLQPATPSSLPSTTPRPSVLLLIPTPPPFGAAASSSRPRQHDGLSPPQRAIAYLWTPHSNRVPHAQAEEMKEQTRGGRWGAVNDPERQESVGWICARCVAVLRRPGRWVQPHGGGGQPHHGNRPQIPASVLRTGARGARISLFRQD